MKPYWQTIFDAMDRTDEWHVDLFNLQHKSGVSFWIANGFTSFRLDSATLPMGLRTKWRLWRKAGKLIARIVAAELASPAIDTHKDNAAGRWMN